MNFEPHPLLKNRHLQTIVGNILPTNRIKSLPKPTFLKLSDGDELALHIFSGNKNFIWILAHGLSGDANASYIQRMTCELLKESFNVILLNHRNCGAGAGRSRNIYHSGRSEDLAEVIQWTKNNFPRFGLGVIGFSMSGNILLKNLIETIPTNDFSNLDAKSSHQQNSLSSFELNKSLDFAIAVNPPIHLRQTSQKIQSGFNRIYERYFVRRVIKTMKEEAISELQQDGRTLKSLDDFYIKSLSGYVNVEEFFEKCSTFNKLTSIKTPTWILTSSDDPFVLSENFPLEEVESNVKCHISQGGGHMGYIHRDLTPLGNRFWMDYAILNKVKEFTS